MIFLLLGSFGCIAALANDLEKEGLHGRIRTVETAHYEMIEKFGEWIAVDLYTSISEYNASGNITSLQRIPFRERVDYEEAYAYDEKGQKKEKLIYLEKRRLIGKEIYEKDRIREKISYDKNGYVSGKTKYDYDGNGYLVEETVYDTAGSVFSKVRYTVRSDGKVSREALYSSNGQKGPESSYEHDESGNKVVEIIELPPRKRKDLHDYDSKNKRIRTTTFFNDSLDSTTVFGYNEKGNLIESTRFAADGTVVEKTTLIYEYDSFGNWISLTIGKDVTKYDKTYFAPYKKVVRRFVYYK